MCISVIYSERYRWPSVLICFQIDEWTKKIRRESRGIDRQIRGKVNVWYKEWVYQSWCFAKTVKIHFILHRITLKTVKTETPRLLIWSVFLLDIQREQEKVKRSIKDAAKKGQKDVCVVLAKEIVQSKQAVSKLYASKAHMNSVVLGMRNQLGECRRTAAKVQGGEKDLRWAL